MAALLSPRGHSRQREGKRRARAHPEPMDTEGSELWRPLCARWFGGGSPGVTASAISRDLPPPTQRRCGMAGWSVTRG